MVNHHDPATIAHDSSVYTFPSGLLGGWPLAARLTGGLFDSGAREVLACHVRYIFVSHRVLQASLASRLYSTTQPCPSASSWEFIITLDFEWDVIRGRRPYRWTIWVCAFFGGEGGRFRHRPSTPSTIEDPLRALDSAINLLHCARDHSCVRYSKSDRL